MIAPVLAALSCAVATSLRNAKLAAVISFLLSADLPLLSFFASFPSFFLSALPTKALPAIAPAPPDATVTPTFATCSKIDSMPYISPSYTLSTSLKDLTCEGFIKSRFCRAILASSNCALA